MAKPYPNTRTAVHNNQEPTDKRWRVKFGRLVHCENRDVRFPAVWEVEDHPKTHGRSVTKSWVIIMDTSSEARQKYAEFEKSLKAPLGRDSYMKDYGLIQVKAGTVVYGRPLDGPLDFEGYRTADNDVFLCGAADGYKLFGNKLVYDLLGLREDLLGSEDFAEKAADISVNKQKTFFPPTYFETLGQKNIKTSRCYSTTMTHQHQRSLVGPTAGGKVYNNGEMQENEKLRKRVVELNSKAAMIALKELAPEFDLALLKENSEHNNLPRIGSEDNTAFPAGQINLAEPVKHEESLVSGLAEMGEFGAEHRDKHDDAGSFTGMVVNSRLPDDYEPGRFHLLALGLYFRLDHLLVPIFCGLALHVGTPPIAPPGCKPHRHAVRFMTVLYPPRSMLSETADKSVPLASLPRGKLLSLGPEITSYEGLKLQDYTNEANWAQDGHILMQPFSHFNFFVRSLLQLCSYLVQQLPTQYKISIKSDVFLSAFTMENEEGERVQATPWSGAPDGSPYDTHETNDTLVLNDISAPDPGDLDINVDGVGNKQSNHLTAQGAGACSQTVGLFTGHSNSIVLRRKLALKWLAHQENRYLFLPISVDNAPDWEKMRKQILVGPHGIRQVKGKGKATSETDKKKKKGKNTANIPVSTAVKISSNMLKAVRHQQTDLNSMKNIDDSDRPRKRLRLDRQAKMSHKEKEAVRDSNEGSGSDKEDEEEREEREHNSQEEQNGNSDDEESDDEEDDDNEVMYTKYGISTDAKNYIPQFLDKLNYNAVFVPLLEFDDAIRARKVYKNAKSQTGTLCGELIMALENKKEATETATTIPSFWNGVQEFEAYISLQAVENRVCRSLLMLAASKTYAWLLAIATDAAEKAITTIDINTEDMPESDTWVCKLAKDVISEWIARSNTPDVSKSVTFHSNKYLPSLPIPRQTEIVVQRWTFNKETQTRETVKAITSIVENWLQFPASDITQSRLNKTRCALICILLKYMPLSVLLLDEVWIMYLKPFHHVIHRRAGQRQSDPHIKETIRLFEVAVRHHCLTDPKSQERHLLAELDKLSEAWFQLIVSKSPKPISQVSPIETDASTTNAIAGSSSGSSLPVAGPDDSFDLKMTMFLNYLHKLKPFLLNGITAYQNSCDSMMQRIAKRPDFLLPFRQKAPMIEKAMCTIYSDTARLRTPEGLWNILSFRGVLYGSIYATEDLQWFNTYEEWDAYYKTSTKYRSLGQKKKGKDKDSGKNISPDNKDKEGYFVNICAYGFNNKSRQIENIASYWAECHRWTSFIDVEHSVKEVYDFLNQKIDGQKIFVNIGPLAALLVCGDLIEAGVIAMPTIEDWANLIYDVGKGATRGLQRLGLVGETFTRPDVIDAFKKLHNFLDQNISPDDRDLMSYNIVMLEHSLCKFTRVVKDKNKANTSQSKSGTKSKSGKKHKRK